MQLALQDFSSVFTQKPTGLRTLKQDTTIRKNASTNEYGNQQRAKPKPGKLHVRYPWSQELVHTHTHGHGRVAAYPKPLSCRSTRITVNRTTIYNKPAATNKLQPRVRRSFLVPPRHWQKTETKRRSRSTNDCVTCTKSTKLRFANDRLQPTNCNHFSGWIGNACAEKILTSRTC